MNQKEMKDSLEEMLINLEVLEKKLLNYNEEYNDFALYLAITHLKDAQIYLRKVVKDAD